MAGELWRQSAQELARRIRTRETTSAEVVQAHLARIEAVNPEVNAIVRVLGDTARAQAAEADRAVASGAPLGPLHGVPFTVKENIDVAGLPTTCGVPALANAVARTDAPVVERLRAAGGVLLARTNLPDMGLRMVTESTLYGITRNPWAAGRTAGGSSGGEAAALAAGMSPLGLGNDLGGSLRNPATACGVASIRPTEGRVPLAASGAFENRPYYVQAMAVEGPMARNVADVRLALQVLMGAHPRDPWSVTLPFAGAQLPRPLRVAALPQPPGGSCDAGVAAVIRHSADALSDAGYEVVEACPATYEEAMELWGLLLATDLRTFRDGLLPLLPAAGAAFLAAFIDRPEVPLGAGGLSKLLVKRDRIARDWSQFMARHPLLLTPAWTQLPFAHGFDWTPEGSVAVLELARPVLPANLLGLPSACVPAGLHPAAALPVGALLTGQRFREDLCLEAAQVVEAAAKVVTPIDPRP